MCVCIVCVDMCVLYVFVCACFYARSCMCVCVCVCACVRAYVHTYVCIYVCMYKTTGVANTLICAIIYNFF